MTDSLSPAPSEPSENQSLPQTYEHNTNELMGDATVAAHKVILGGPDGMPRMVTTSLERRLVKERAADAIDSAENFKKTASLEEENESLREETRWDKATEMPTTKVLDEDLNQAISLAVRENAGTVLVEIDGSGLKAVNDELGKPFGDQLILATSKGVKDRTRGQDKAYRGQGISDEFYILIPLIHLTEDKAQGFFDTLTAGIATSVDKRISEVPELENIDPKYRKILGASVGIAWADFTDPKYQGMTKEEVAHDLKLRASLEGKKHKKQVKEERNNARVEAGEPIPDDARFH